MTALFSKIKSYSLWGKFLSYKEFENLFNEKAKNASIAKNNRFSNVKQYYARNLLAVIKVKFIKWHIFALELAQNMLTSIKICMSLFETIHSDIKSRLI